MTDLTKEMRPVFLFCRLLIPLGLLCFIGEASAQAPANDNFSNRINLSGSVVSTTGSNVNATGETGEPFNYSGRNSVWWSWTAPASGTVTIRTAGSNFDTTLAAFTGTSVSALTQIASNDDVDGTLQSRIDFSATAGVAYRIQVSGYSSSSVGSISLSISQSGASTSPTITSHPASTTINSGSTTTLSVTATGTAPLSYQWYQGSSGTTTTPVGSNSASFTTPSLSATTSYWVRVSNSAGSASSNTATVTVNPPAIAPSITSHPASISINSGATTTLSVTASGTAPLTYQWYQGASGTTTTPVGTNSSSFTTPALTSNTSYWVRVSNSAGSVNSNSASVTVIVPPSITSQPSSSTVEYSSSVTLSVSANGTTPLAYQWYQGSSGTTTSPVGTNSSTFTTPNLTSTTSYWVRVSNAAGNASSNTATITVGPPPSAPAITTQPASTSVSVGNTATFSVVATGSQPLSYQWYEGASGTTTTPVGTNSSSFTTPALTTATSTARYWVRVSNSVGAVNSNTATVTITVPVNIPDPALLAALRAALSKPAGDITEADLLTLTNLNIANKGITNLSGLEKATNLRVLDIRRNNFTDIEGLWTILDSLSLYCLYVDVRRPGVDPVGFVTQTLTDTSGNTFFVTVDAPNLPTLDFASLSVDTSNPTNISALQTISSSGVTVDTGGINLPPYANASASLIDEDTRQVSLSASGSSDVDGTITGYAWTWSGGTANGATATVTLPYGTTSVILTVTDNQGASGSATVQVTIDRPYSEPVITNLSAAQRAGTRLVDILYDIDAVTPMVATSVRVSSDSGETFEVPATTLNGDHGAGVVVGTGKTITWNAGADWPEQFSETVRFEVSVDDRVGTPSDMALIPAGNFTIGRTSGDTDADAPPVEVTVSAFYMGKNEITKELWDEVRTWAMANGYTDLAEGDGKAADHPVHSISWFDMVKWCNARSQKEGLTPCYTVSGAVMKTGTTAPTVDWSANGYRLPTEAEWEKAARGGKSGKRFPWGTDTISHSQANYRSSSLSTYDLSAAVNNYHPTYATGSQPFTSPVGDFEPNSYGLHDMAGNVWEWCWDWAGGTYLTGATDPRGPSSGTGRIRRGGAWNSDSIGCRSAGRPFLPPSETGNLVGFRVARTPVAAVIPPRITVQPASMTTVDSGVTLTVSATGTRPLSYQWYQGQVGNTTNPVGTNSPTYTTLPWTPTTSYWVRVSNAAGSVDSLAAVVDDFSQIPAGSFTMGRTSGDTISDAPPVTVTLSAFYIGKNEVSKELWDEVRNWAVANGYTDLVAGAGKAHNHPVVGVSWWDVIKWCNARSEKEGLTPCYTVSGAVIRAGTTAPTVNWSANGYRLPTEAEWEKSARGGVSGKRFPWGADTISHSEANFNNIGGEPYQSGTTGQHPLYKTGDFPYTSPLGSFLPNGYGLYDMAGNVWEWCWDWYGVSTYVDGVIDPFGAPSGTGRVYRGGSWNANSASCRSAWRALNGPSTQYSSLGFRLARSSVPSGPLPPAISIQPGSISINRGETATLTVSAGGANPLTYQWYQGSVGVTTTPVGTNSASFTTPALNVTRSYWVRVSNAAGSVNSELVTVSVIQPPAITVQPASSTVAPGQTATVAVSASGTAPLTYQWYQGAVGVTTSPVGTSSASFTTSALSETTAFWVRVTNAAGTVDSGLATVTVATAPSITAQPASSTITSGSTATLSVTASGTAPLTYQWYQGAVGTTTTPVGTNSATFTTPALTATTTYWVRVSNMAGSVNSNAAIITTAAGSSSNVAVFDNPSYVDTSGGIAAESDNLQAMLTASGHSVAPFTGISAAEITAALVDKKVLLIPELEIADLAAALDANARNAIRDFVNNGGGLIVHGQSGSRDENLVNQVFGLALVQGSTAYSGSSSISKVNATGTQFSAGPANLIEADGTYMTLSSSLPTNATSIYTHSSIANNTAVARIPFGAGLIVLLSYDGYNLSPVGSQDGGWRQVIDLAVREVSIGSSAPVAPSITAQPASSTSTSGSTATLSVTASGTAPLTYQWYQGAVGTTTTPVGTNSASFTTPALTATTTYWVRITNAAGTVDSTLATVTVGGSTADELALIPAGAFQMGVTSGDTDSDAPSVSVTVSAFYVGKNEVTKALWDEVRTWAVANGYTDLAAGAGKAANHPVQTVSWWDVIKWCNARSEKEGLTPCYTVSGAVMKTGTTAPTVNWSANGYRLPTEAEWEKAARGGVSGKRFPWGTDTISHSQANYYASTSYSYDSSGSVNNRHPTYNDGVFPYTSPVGSFAANGYGLHDMAGNVWEWCWDWYGSSTYVNGATDPRGAASGTYRVNRGGSWSSLAGSCRAAFRNASTPSDQSYYFGFRIARSSVP